MGKEIDLSIIIPFYKGEKFIVRNLQSILNSYNVCSNKPFIETLLIIDSVETDISDVEELIEFFAESLCIKVFKNEKNLGVAKTRNFSIDVSQGNYLYFLDQDDEVSESFFNAIVTANFQLYDFILTNGYLSYDNNRKYKIFYVAPKVDIKNLILDDFVRSPGQVIIQKSILNNELKFPIPQKHFGSDDKFFYLSIFKKSNPKYLYIDSPLYIANLHADNYSNNQIESWLSSLELFELFTNNNNLTVEENKYVQRAIAAIDYKLGKLKGLNRFKGALYFLLYKVKINKLLRFLIRKIK